MNIGTQKVSASNAPDVDNVALDLLDMFGLVKMKSKQLRIILKYLLKNLVDVIYAMLTDGCLSSNFPKHLTAFFLKNKQCQIYPVRPTQCQTFPWWPQIMASEEEWNKTARQCEGIRAEAPTVPFEIIQEQLDRQKKSSA